MNFKVEGCYNLFGGLANRELNAVKANTDPTKKTL